MRSKLIEKHFMVVLRLEYDRNRPRPHMKQCVTQNGARWNSARCLEKMKSWRDIQIILSGILLTIFNDVKKQVLHLTYPFVCLLLDPYLCILFNSELNSHQEIHVICDWFSEYHSFKLVNFIQRFRKLHVLNE